MLGTAFDRNTYSFGHCPSVGVTDSDPNLAFYDRLSGTAFFCTSVLPAVAGVVVSFILCLHPGLKQNSSVLWAVAGVVSLPIDLKQNWMCLWMPFSRQDLKQNWMCLWMPFSRQVQA